MAHAHEALTQEQIEKLNSLAVDQIEKVYRGKPGCGCGCKGYYSETKMMKNRVLGILKSRIDEVGCDGNVYWIEDDTRYYWLYVAAWRGDQ